MLCLRKAIMQWLHIMQRFLKYLSSSTDACRRLLHCRVPIMFCLWQNWISCLNAVTHTGQQRGCVMSRISCSTEIQFGRKNQVADSCFSNFLRPLSTQLSMPFFYIFVHVTMVLMFNCLSSEFRRPWEYIFKIWRKPLLLSLYNKAFLWRAPPSNSCLLGKSLKCEKKKSSPSKSIKRKGSSSSWVKIFVFKNKGHIISRTFPSNYKILCINFSASQKYQDLYKHENSLWIVHPVRIIYNLSTAKKQFPPPKGNSTFIY